MSEARPDFDVAIIGAGHEDVRFEQADAFIDSATN